MTYIEVGEVEALITTLSIPLTLNRRNNDYQTTLYSSSI